MEYKTINYEQGKIEYGSEEIYVSIISKFINMTFEKQLQELYLAVQLLDQKRMEKACFVLKGSVGQILAFDYLQKTNALYDIAKKQQPHTDRDIIDLYHRYFDLIDASILLADELSTAAKQLINITEIQSYSKFQCYAQGIRFGPVIQNLCKDTYKNTASQVIINNDVSNAKNASYFEQCLLYILTFFQNQGIPFWFPNQVRIF
ncbi:unnamed protein product (macronuclear) [Paramecium tetraurelia]|uniref:Uncharacterized protein n=1 Tax=Paramecium tetraurelia TaxID=5888 RepID=A0CPK8_PARTE|nr:uncharacterized protein GSPATT00009117001 [Paramecium tetraurelia]CAK72725.1 unnamed protein product [Paramecium tetraurelia]|eukprot:XP_001440122.1 hypothetical protein (macronuclear) [Paramecium tetraurelia strain d4-2]